MDIPVAPVEEAITRVYAGCGSQLRGVMMTAIDQKFQRLLMLMTVDPGTGTITSNNCSGLGNLPVRTHPPNLSFPSHSWHCFALALQRKMSTCQYVVGTGEMQCLRKKWLEPGTDGISESEKVTPDMQGLMPYLQQTNDGLDPKFMEQVGSMASPPPPPLTVSVHMLEPGL